MFLSHNFGDLEVIFLEKSDMGQEMLTLSGTPGFISSIIYTLQNLSVLELCLWINDSFAWISRTALSRTSFNSTYKHAIARCIYNIINRQTCLYLVHYHRMEAPQTDLHDFK